MCLRDGGDNGPGPGTYSSRQQALVLHSVSIINIMPCIIDVNVINSYHYLRGKGGQTITLRQRAQW